MSGINNVVKGDGCVLKRWVCRSQPCFVSRVYVCVCVLLFPDSVLSSLQHCFALLCLCFEAFWGKFRCKTCEKCKVMFFLTLHVGVSKTRPHEQSPPSVAQPSLHKTRISSTGRQCLLSEVTARTLTRCHSWTITQCDLFPSFTLALFSTSPLVFCLSVCLCLL